MDYSAACGWVGVSNTKIATREGGGERGSSSSSGSGNTSEGRDENNLIPRN